MKRISFICAFIILLGVGIVSAASEVEVTVTYTADNEILAWYLVQQDSDTTSLPLGSNCFDWREADSLPLNLVTGQTYQFVWQTRDAGYPGGFLAQINSTEIPLAGSLFSSADWEVAHVQDDISTTPPPDFDLLPWVSATEWGANDDPTTTWGTYHGMIEGIANDAEWIWTEANSGPPDAPDGYDSVFVRATIEIPFVPEPDFSGCINYKSSPLEGVKVILKVQNDKKQVTETDQYGCFEINDAGSGKWIELRIGNKKADR